MTRVLFILALIISGYSFHFKKKKVIPPGTVQITDTFFADETEVSNLSWLEYEFWAKSTYGSKSKEHLATLPDTLVWRSAQCQNEPYVTNYYRHPAYKNYPVVGISYEQALAFCKWRTDRVKQFYALAKKKDLNLEYTLPGKAQWEFLCIDGSGAIMTNGKNNKDQVLLNYYRADEDTASVGADVTAPVYSYYKNNFGLFNTIGNVSEMILEKGVAKGGSWHHALEECRVGKDNLYTKPEAWLGFRCICIVKPVSL